MSTEPEITRATDTDTESPRSAASEPTRPSSNLYAGHEAGAVFLASDAEWRSSIVARREPTKFASTRVMATLPSVAELMTQLRACAGDCVVRVEQRRDANDRFGVGNECLMRVDDVLDRLERGDDRVYLSAQPLKADGRSGLARLASSPMAELLRARVFEARPPPLRELVPANVNLWLGFASEGASSGLHHDYHDNLYVLLSGEKEFLLIAPSHAERCYTHGTIARVHANGVINYVGEETRSDGATPFQVRWFAHMRQQRQLEAELEEAERDVRQSVPGAKARAVKIAKSLLAMAPLAEADDDDLSGGDDDDDDGGLFGGVDDDDSFPDDSDDFGDSDDAAAAWSDGHDDFDELEKEDALELLAAAPAEAEATPAMPPSFSRIADPVDFDAAAFPLFVGVPVHRVVLKAGDALYLPAGWFHCVKSKGGLHCAINWWFNPGPYEDELFATEWAERVAGGEVVAPDSC
jgi:hypothetical protein